MDIFVSGLQFVGKHGVYEEERVDGRRFKVDVTVTLNDRVAIDDTRLETTIDYRKLAEVVLKHGQGESVQLIETLAERILHDIFSLSTRVEHIDLTIFKRATGVPGDPEWVGVRFSRERPPRPRPRRQREEI